MCMLLLPAVAGLDGGGCETQHVPEGLSFKSGKVEQMLLRVAIVTRALHLTRNQLIAMSHAVSELMLSHHVAIW